MKLPMISLLEKAKLGFKKKKIFDDRIKFHEIPQFQNVFVPILYDFSDSDEVWAEVYKDKSLAPFFDEIKLSLIEFLYYFVKEDIDAFREDNGIQFFVL